MSKSSFEEELDKKGILVYTNKGNSMYPLIRQGKDVLIIKKCNTRLKKMDVPLYKRDSGQYVLHRIVKVNSNDYVLRGDNTYYNETGIRDDQILGVLSGIIREGKEISVNSFWYKLYTYFWYYTYYLRKTIIKIKRCIR